MPSERVLRLVAGALAIAGIGVATYLTIADSSGDTPACAAGGHGCATVANSSYSHLLGSLSPCTGSSATCCFSARRLPGDYGRFAGFGLALVGFGFSAYLTYLELEVINAICQWCVASAVTMTLLLSAQRGDPRRRLRGKGRRQASRPDRKYKRRTT